MEVHDDILDTIEMINDEMKKYTEQMKSAQHAPEYQIFYDRLKIKQDLEELCKINIRKRAFPAIYDFQQEDKIVIYEFPNSNDTNNLVKTQIPVQADVFAEIPKFAEVVSNEL